MYINIATYAFLLFFLFCFCFCLFCPALKALPVCHCNANTYYFTFIQLFRKLKRLIQSWNLTDGCCGFGVGCVAVVADGKDVLVLGVLQRFSRDSDEAGGGIDQWAVAQRLRGWHRWRDVQQIVLQRYIALLAHMKRHASCQKQSYLQTAQTLYVDNSLVSRFSNTASLRSELTSIRCVLVVSFRSLQGSI